MTTPIKVLVALNVATLVAVLLLGAFVVVRVNDTSQQVASLSAKVPEGGVASQASVDDVLAATQETSQAVTDLTAQVAALSTTLGTMETQLAAIAGATASAAPGASFAPDSTLGKVMAAIQTLQATVTRIQDDVATVQGFVKSVCSALGRC
jgi:predicted PurR-regulated permease PerM